MITLDELLEVFDKEDVASLVFEEGIISAASILFERDDNYKHEQWIYTEDQIYEALTKIPLNTTLAKSEVYEYVVSL